MKRFIIFLFIIVLVFPLAVLARIGVGIGIGEIKVDESLKPGGIYNLPDLVVINTGTEPTNYEMGVAYYAHQEEMRPAQEWFSFNPSSFLLEPGKSQNVAVKLTLPVKKVEPGNYFAYLEACQAVEAKPGTTAIGVAAATKLYFTMIPANIWQAIYYRVSTFFNAHSPWSWIVLGIVLGTIVIFILWRLFRKYFAFQIKFKKETKSKNGLETNLESDLKSKPKRKRRQTK